MFGELDVVSDFGACQCTRVALACKTHTAIQAMNSKYIELSAWVQQGYNSPGDYDQEIADAEWQMEEIKEAFDTASKFVSKKFSKKSSKTPKAKGGTPSKRVKKKKAASKS
jgi:hypothetical protein